MESKKSAPHSSATLKIGFLGYGRMAQAISQGLDRDSFIPYTSQLISDPYLPESILAERKVRKAAGNQDLIKQCRLIFLAVKPHQIAEVLREIKPQLTSEHLLISVAAGVTLASIRADVPTSTSLVRIMPNLPVAVGKGAISFCAEAGAALDLVSQAREILAHLGLYVDLDEKYFDAATSLSGSGPAYFFSVLDALSRGGVRLGLSWETSRALALQSASGAAALAAQEASTTFAQLRDDVTSPGGSTAEALYILEKGGLTALFQEALEAATNKNKKLGGAS